MFRCAFGAVVEKHSCYDWIRIHDQPKTEPQNQLKNVIAEGKKITNVIYLIIFLLLLLLLLLLLWLSLSVMILFP